MSKLETAFSKALKENSQNEQNDVAVTEEEQRDTGTAPISVTAEQTGISRAPGFSNVVAIRQMSEREPMSERELEAKGLIHPGMKDQKLLDIYRNLRTKLLAAADGKNFTTLVTSVLPGDDTSLIAANIAATFAFDEGKTAMLLEGRVHSPDLARLFDLEGDEPGLLDYLSSEDRGLGSVIHSTGIPRLRFVPGGQGRDSSSEFFTSARMKAAVEEIVTRYPDRYPIINAPSVQDSADARILLDLCDQAVLVIPYGECTETDIKRAAEAIGHDKLAGVILNQF